MDPQLSLPKSVLVVDDNVDAADSLVMLFTVHGYAARAAHDGVCALEMAERFHPHVIVMDLNMPRMDGLGAAAAIRARRDDVILVALTACFVDANQGRAAMATFDHCLLKPTDVERLLRVVGAPKLHPG